MVAQLKVRSEEPVVAVLESRGASGNQILLIYFLEVLLLGGTALLLGIPLGWGMCRILGSTNGFLEFVSRTALPLEISETVYIYATIAFFGVVLTTLAPALVYSRKSIVEQKQKAARKKQPVWKRLFIDILLLGASIYYLYRMKDQTEFLSQLGLSGIEGRVDSVIYLASTIFTVGAGLCFLRIYPLLISLIYKAGRRFWSPVPFAALHTIMNSGGKESFLMFFIILSLSVGLFSAGAARTINRNTEDRIRNEFGADIVTRQHWIELDENGRPIVDAVPAGIGHGRFANAGASDSEVTSFVEPPFIDFQMLEGVSGVAKVLRSENTRIKVSSGNTTTTFIAFDPYDFAHTTWWRSDLAPYALNEYMNIMMEYPGAAVLSESLREQLGLREGDKIRVDPFSNGNTVELDILAFVDYWPSFSPYTMNRSGNLVREHMIVANLEYIFARMPRSPYDVWIRKMPGVSDADIFDRLEEMKTPFKRIDTLIKPMVEAKNDPALQGTNGVLSLSFIIAMLICSLGFLIYWILSINSRVLQFGVLRAMGLTQRKIYAIIIWEQILVSGSALAAGITIGNVTMALFLPVFRLLYSGVEQNIPFKVFSAASESTRIMILFSIMLTVLLFVLVHMIRQIKIDQVLKLGED